MLISLYVRLMAKKPAMIQPRTPPTGSFTFTCGRSSKGSNIGLLLYAQDAQGKKVGSWELPKEDEIMFHTPPGSCEEKAVMHSGADPKNYHNVFAFRAPPKDTGDITFKCLLKTGPANTGAFHWPNKGGALVLTEKAGQPPQSWVKASKGKTCDQTCQGANKVCDNAKMLRVTSQSQFLNTIGKEHVCKLPILKGCAMTDPSMDGTDEFCYYHSAQCTKTQSCGAKVGTNFRYCPCKAGSNLNEDSWTEMTDGLEAWQDPTAPKAKSGCSQFYKKAACEAAGCAFSEEEGMVICE